MGERPEALATWYGSTSRLLVASLIIALGDPEAAREAADEAFFRAFVRWRRVSAMNSPTGWTYRVALNVARRRLRRSAIERRLMARRETVLQAAGGEVWALLDELPTRQRTAVALRYGADMTEADIAAVMGLSRGTVSSALVDARRRLAKLLMDEGEENDYV